MGTVEKKTKQKNKITFILVRAVIKYIDNEFISSRKIISKYKMPENVFQSTLILVRASGH